MLHTYVNGHLCTKALTGKTPYEAWHGRKPDVSHLRKFGSPVYVLLQGQKTPPKLLPRSKQQIFVGYDDRSKSIKYYNLDTRKVLTSRNYKFLTYLPDQSGMPEPMSNFPPLCHVRGSMANYNPHCNREVSVLNQRDNVRSLKLRVMKTRMPESFERKRQLTIVT